MSDLPIIIRRAYQRPATYADETERTPLQISYASKRMQTGVLKGLGGSGPFGQDVPVMRSVGLDKSQVMVSERSGIFHVPLTAAGVKRYLRRMRPEEHERLVAIDTDIAVEEAKLKLMRGLRRTIVAEAWKRGHVVTVKELRERAERRDEDQERRGG